MGKQPHEFQEFFAQEETNSFSMSYASIVGVDADSHATPNTTLAPKSEKRTIYPLEGVQGCLREMTATGTTSMEDHVDSITTADSGYHSGPRTSCTNAGDGGVPDDDADSVVTDGWPSSLPRQDKYLLEAEFAREIFNRSSAKTRERFAERGETVKDLLYSFSVMIGRRASSAAERGAASFVRRGRKYVSPSPDSRVRGAHVLIV
jgi:hypothetical protein